MKNEETEDIKSLKNQIERLEKRIRILESELLSKDIIIDALVIKAKIDKTENENLNLKREFREDSSGDQESNIKRVKQSINQIEKPKEVESREIITCLPGLEFTDPEDTPTKQKEKNEELPIQYEKLITEIKQVFKTKSKKIEFKANFTFMKFVEYCESSYEFSLTNKKVFKSKNPLRQFILTNMDRIIKFLIDNINTLNLNRICSTFFLLNSEIEYSHKLVIFHDITLELNNCSKLIYIASVLFNNQDFSCDLFSQLIKKILFHQISIDCDLIRDTEVIEYFNLISDNLALSPPDISLWESLSHFMVKHQLFDPIKLTIKSEAIEKGFMLRMVCHYLDWNYTYNTFIVTQLFPKIIAERSPIHIYYLGILTMNAYRLFGNHESVTSIFEELKSILEWNDQCSVVAYLILKQIYEIESEEWIDRNGESLTSKGFDLGYLRKLLLI